MQAIYFDMVITNFINELLGWGKPNKLGILGKIKSYYGIVEAQGRGSLHVHMLVWLDDATTPADYKEKIKNSIYKEKLIE